MMTSTAASTTQTTQWQTTKSRSSFSFFKIPGATRSADQHKFNFFTINVAVRSAAPDIARCDLFGFTSCQGISGIGACAIAYGLCRFGAAITALFRWAHAHCRGTRGCLFGQSLPCEFAGADAAHNSISDLDFAQGSTDEACKFVFAQSVCLVCGRVYL
jgi:hypothetical protein